MVDDDYSSSASSVDKSELMEILRNNSKLESSESLDSDSESPKANNISATDPKDPSAKIQKIKCNGINRENANKHLNYEVEDGECSDSENKKSEKLKNDDKEVENVSEELEEGEILDDDNTSMVETFPTRNVCKFFLRGRCTWGTECKFLHCDLTDNGDYNKLEPVKSVVSHLAYNGNSLTEVSNVWEHSLRMSRYALLNSCKYKKKLQEESTSEIIFTRRHRQTRKYSPKRYEPEYSRIRPRESCRSTYKHEDRDLYRSRRPKREVSISHEKEAWTDPWRRSNSTTSPKKRKRNYSSSSDCSSDSSRKSHKKHDRHNWENQRSLNRKETKEQSRSEKFRRSRERITTNPEKTRRHGKTKRSIKSSSSSSDSDRSVSNVKENQVTKNRQRSSSPPAVPKRKSAKKRSERKILLEKLKNIEKAIAKHKKLKLSK